jgi:TolB-like protein
MKKYLWSFILSAVFIGGIFISPAAADFKKTKIAVLDFQLQGMKQDSSDMGKIVAEWLITALVKEGRFDVIERRLLAKVIEEQKIGASGIVDESSASKLGKVLGAKIVITGSVMQFQNMMEVNARIIEVESSSIMAAESVKSTNAAKLEDLVVQMADRIIKDFPLEGYIVQRDNKSVIIDLGKRAGVKRGMRFIVYREGDVIKHPKTGEILDIERIETGSLEIQDVKTKMSNAVIVAEIAPNAIASGQLVKSTVELVPLSQDSGMTDSEPVTNRIAPSGDLMAQLAAVDAMSEEVGRLKAAGNGNWKKKYKEVDHQLDLLERQNRRSPDVYLSRAKSMEAIGKLSHVEKYIHKALSVSRHYPAAYSLKGDIYSRDALKSSPLGSIKRDYKIAIDAYESAIKSSGDKNFQAMMYLKMGNAAADILQNRDKAVDFWQKSIKIAPGSEGARLSRARM